MIFEVTPDHIEKLGDADLRTLVGRMAEQEAIKQGYSSAGITYGGHQNAPDGGIDVRADLPSGDVSGYIPRCQTGFQVKAEDFGRASILKEMRPNDNLREAIADLADRHGAYVIVSSKGSVADTSLKDRRAAMSDALADLPQRDQLYVDFYDRQRIATWVNQNPGLIPWVRERVGLSISGWRPFGDWSSSPGSTDEEYFTDDHFRLKGAKLNDQGSLGIVAGIDRLREILAEPKAAIRLVGLSGVGKTKFVQALFDGRLGSDSISPHYAIYTDVADEPDPVPSELLGYMQSLGQRCIIVIDNCGIALHRKLVAQQKLSPAAVNIITIEYDIADDTPENTDVFKLEPASEAIIEKIVERRYSQLTQPEIRTIAKFSEGNFRVALVLAETAREGESLANLNDGELFKRLFRQKNEDNPALLRAAMACSLVYSFDGETLEGEAAELPILAHLAGQSVDDVYAHVAELYRRQLVQKRAQWRAILPHALAHRLAKQALQDIPTSKVVTAFSGNVPERLLKSFSRRIGCLHDSPEAQKIVELWLGQDGELSKIEELNTLGLTLLDNIAPVAPQAVLESFEKAATRGRSLFEMEHSNCQRALRLLRALAYDADNFERAINLIAEFTGDGSDSNNLGDAINVFKSLFTLYLSGTHAPPKARAETILKFARKGNERDHILALSALRTMFQTDHFMSSFEFDFGTRKRDYGYEPRSRQDYIDWYEAALNVAAKLAELPEMQHEVKTMVAQQLPRLVTRTGMLDQIVAVGEIFITNGGWPEGWVGARSALRRLRSTDRQEDIEKIQALIERLQPRSISDRIASYLSPQGWSVLDIVDIDFDDKDKRRAAEEHANEVGREIGRELAENLELLKKHLPALAGAESYRVVTTMNEVGKCVSDIARAWALVKDQCLAADRKGSYNLAGMFLRGVAAQNPAAAETILDEAIQDEALHGDFITMQVNVELTERGIARIERACAIETVPTWTFGRLGYSVNWKNHSTTTFVRILRAIAEREDAAEVAFDLMTACIHHHRSDKTPLDDIEKQAGVDLLTGTPFNRENNTKGYDYKEIAEACLDSEKDKEPARHICRDLYRATIDFRIYPHDYVGFAGVLAEKFPRVVLDELIDGASENSGVPELFANHRIGKLNPASKIGPDVALAWAEERSSTRYANLAHVIPLWEKIDGTDVPFDEFEETSGAVRWTGIARKLLAQAPDRVAVLKVMVERFRPNGWSGSLAAILQSRLPLLEELAQDCDPEIARAAAEAIPAFREQIESTREWEARHDRERDERFEW